MEMREVIYEYEPALHLSSGPDGPYGDMAATEEQNMARQRNYDVWRKRAAMLNEYYKKNGKLPPVGDPLTSWLHAARQTFKRDREEGEFDEKFYAEIYALTGGLIEPKKHNRLTPSEFEEKMQKLKAYLDANSGNLPPVEEPEIGQFVVNARINHARGYMSEERKKRFLELKKDFFAPIAGAKTFVKNVDKIIAFKKEHGRLPGMKDDPKLGQWIINQRSLYRTERLGKRLAQYLKEHLPELLTKEKIDPKEKFKSQLLKERKHYAREGKLRTIAQSRVIRKLRDGYRNNTLSEEEREMVKKYLPEFLEWYSKL